MWDNRELEQPRRRQKPVPGVQIVGQGVQMVERVKSYAGKTREKGKEDWGES